MVQKTLNLPPPETAVPRDSVAAELPNRMLTAQELAAYLRVNRSTIYRLLKKGKLPGFRIGSEWRFQMDEVNRWFKARDSVGN
jgi:excisionase family DNA binding protein